MPIRIVRDDITLMRVDAIVNPTNSRLIATGGADGAVHKRAGAELDAECEKIGWLESGRAAMTKGYNLPAKYIIHTVGPIWRGGDRNESETLANCYKNCLNLALKNKCKSVAFPLISSGSYGFPTDEALAIADREIRLFLEDHDTMLVYIVIFGKRALQESLKLYSDISRFIDDNYVSKRLEDSFQYAIGRANSALIDREEESLADLRRREKRSTLKEPSDFRAKPVAPSKKENKIRGGKPIFETDKSFFEKVAGYIDEYGWKDSHFYSKANITKQHFSKMKKPGFHPKKETACACALALELDYGAAIDLLQTAGYTLSKSIMFDVIIEYCIRNKIYNITKVNIMLFEYDLTTL